jgi:tetratricopeptide (TPR) repeat protein
MTVPRFHFALTTVIAIVVWVAAPTIVRAQYTANQCTWVLQQLTQSLTDAQRTIPLERQYLTFCKDYTPADEYLLHLGALASALNNDGQHQEALGVANRCLQSNSAELPCLFEKANALKSLGSIREAKLVIESSLVLGAITEIDASAKRNLQDLLRQVNAALNADRPSVSAQPTAESLNAITKLPGGVKCADLFNNGQLACALDIEIGVITTKTPDDVRYLLAHRDTYPQKILGSAVTLNSLGGSLPGALEVGKIIREQKLKAVVDSSAKCVSACVFVLAGANRRQIKGSVGIHRPFFMQVGNAGSPDVVIQNYGAALKQAREYLTSMGVSDRLLDEMLRIEPNDVRYLTRAELDTFALGEGPPGDNMETVASLKEAVAIKAAAAYGLTRLEYERRSALIDRTCRFAAYQSPFEPPNFAAYGEIEGKPKMSTRNALAQDLETEERGWSQCYKAVMIHGR